MHTSSKVNMQSFIARYIDGSESVLDVGSFNVNGTYRPFFKNYTGLDIIEGDNVDIVADEPYAWPIKNNTYDVVVSGQTFEHIEFPKKTMQEIYRVLKPGGLCCIIAPSAGPQHGFPNDYRRYTEHSMIELAEHGKLDVVETHTTYVGIWKDVMLIARKPE